MIARAALAVAKDGEGVKSGPIGLAVILVLCVACYFLFKSMSKQLRKVREEFPDDSKRQSVDMAKDLTNSAGQAPVANPADVAPPKPDPA